MSQIEQCINAMMPHIINKEKITSQKANKHFLKHKDFPIINLQNITSIEIYEENCNITFYFEKDNFTEWQFTCANDLRIVFNDITNKIILEI